MVTTLSASRNTVRILFIALAVAVLAAGIVAARSRASSSAPPPIKLASVLSLTGPTSAFGILAQQGVQTAVQYINAHGGINGRKIIYENLDDQSSAAQTSALFQQVASDSSVLGVIGPSAALDGPAGAVAANNLHIPTITLNGDANTSDNPGPWVFRTAATFQMHAEAILRFCKQSLHRGIIGLEYQNAGYGATIDKYMKSEAASYGVKVIDQGVDPTSTDVTSAYEKLLSAGANVIVSVHTTNVASSIIHWRSIGSKVPFVESIAASNPLSIGAGDQSLVGSPVLAYFSGDTAQRGPQLAFEQYFRKLWHKTAYYNSATGSDAVHLFAEAIAGLKNPTRDSVRTTLEKLPTYTGAGGIIKWSPTNHQGFNPKGFEWLLYKGHGKFTFLTSGLNPRPVKLP
jgi:branched-chain amino acid transport system substrate-binding protein